MKCTGLIFFALGILSATPGLANGSCQSSLLEESPYSFREMNCTGTKPADSKLSADFGAVAIRIVSQPGQLTDILGQTKGYELAWGVSIHRSVAEAAAVVNDPNRGGNKIFSHHGLTQQQVGHDVVVRYVDNYFNIEYLHLVKVSSNGNEDRFRGTYMFSQSSPEKYEVECVATR